MTTRRSFLTGAAGLCGTAALPAWAEALQVPRKGERSVLLFTDRAHAPSHGLDAVTTVERRPLSLDTAADNAHVEGAALLATGHSALVALGTPAAVFALRTQLGSHWHVIVQGLHGADGQGAHRLDVPTVLAPALSSVLAHARSEDEFAAVLVNLAGEAVGLSHEVRTTQRLNSQRWDGKVRASLLARPMRKA